MENCCDGMGIMMWVLLLLGAALLVVLIMWIIKQIKNR